MYLVMYAGKFYGPFVTADDAAHWATMQEITAPWQIVKLRNSKDGL